MEAIHSSESSVDFWRTKRRSVSEGSFSSTSLNVYISYILITASIYKYIGTLFVTASKDYALTVLHTSQITIGHTRSSQSVTFLTNRCLVAASNGGRSPSSVFPNCPLLSNQFLTATAHNTWTPAVILLKLMSKSKLCYDRQFSRPVCLGIKHPSGA
jgi:hypothetical protein